MDRLQTARALYMRGEMHDALEAAQAACERAPRDAEAWRLLAAICLHSDLPAAADDAFARAAACSRRHPSPARVSRQAFQAIVDGSLAELSPDGRRRLAGARVVIEDLPDLGAIRAGGLAPDALSGRRRQPDDVLEIYQLNHENRSASAEQLRKLVGRTLSRA